VNVSVNEIAVIIRSYNNKHISKRVCAYLDMGVGRVIVVMDASKDQGATPAWLRHINDPRLQLIELHAGYSWSNALNAGLESVRISNWSGGNFRFVLPGSVEAHLLVDQLVAMLSAMKDETVGVVGTTFDARLDNNAVQLGRSYNHPRNTAMLIRLATLDQCPGDFSARCDALGGMEDIDFVLRMHLVASFRAVMLDLKVKLILGEHYNQTEKEKREQLAMDKIIAHWRNICRAGGHEIERVNRVVAEMQLEV